MPDLLMIPLQAMAGDDGEDDDEDGGDEYTQCLDPESAHPDQSLNVRLAHADMLEWRGRLGLLQQGEQGRERVVGRKEEVGGDEERQDEL